MTAAGIGRRHALLAIGVLLTLFAAGCTGRPAGTPRSPAPASSAQDPRSPAGPQVHPLWRSCTDEPSARRVPYENDASTLPRLAGTFHPVSAVLCARASQSRPDGGTDLVATEDRIDDLAALLAALRLPDEPPSAAFCPAGLVARPWLALLDAQGHWVRPGIPVDGCAAPRDEVTTAIDKARRTRIATRVLHEIESAGAARSGCADDWADMVQMTGARSATRPAEEPVEPPGTGAALYACIYRVPPSEQGTDKPRGEIVSRELLPAGRWAAIRRQVRAAGPARACSTPASRFALLLPGNIYVELDGCRRILAPAAAGAGSDTLRQAPTALPELLGKP